MTKAREGHIIMKKRSERENEEREILNDFIKNLQDITVGNYCKKLNIQKSNIYRNRTSLKDLRRVTNLLIIDLLQLIYELNVRKAFMEGKDYEEKEE